MRSFLTCGGYLRVGLTPAILVTLFAVTSLFGQQGREPVGDAGSVDQDAGQKAVRERQAADRSEETPDTAGNYGNHPDATFPYGNFQEPYKRFFMEQIPFLGTGRGDELDSMPKTVRIGFFAPVQTAPDADLGQFMLEGMQLAIEHANAAGGYKGIPFELMIRPDLGMWGASSNEMVAFKYEDDVLGVIGSIDGANTHIALRVVLKLEMPMMNTSSTDPTVTETNIPWLVRCMADDRQQGYALATHIYGECGIRNVVAFRVSDRYGRLGIMEFRDAATRLGFPLRYEVQWRRGDRDFTQPLNRIAELAPEAVVIWGNSGDCAAIVKEVWRRNMPIRLFGADRMACQAFLDSAGEAAEGIVAAASWDPTRDDPKLKAFVESYTKRFQHEPEAFAAHTYDGANILIDAIHKGGINRPRIRDALYECTRYEGVTGLIELDSSLNDVGPVYIATVKNGQLLYREVKFAGGIDESTEVGPYRELGQSPPKALSPDDRTGESTDTIRIGCFLPLDDRGQAIVRGMQSAVDEDLRTNPQQAPIRLVVLDPRGAWGGNSDALVDMIHSDRVLALVGSTERHGTHLAEVLASKVHFPVLSLCGTDPTITAIPLPWIFCLVPTGQPDGGGVSPAGVLKQIPDCDRDFDLGYDAASLLVQQMRGGRLSRKTLRDGLAGIDWYRGRTGTFRFDALGNRVDSQESVSVSAEGSSRVTESSIDQEPESASVSIGER